MAEDEKSGVDTAGVYNGGGFRTQLDNDAGVDIVQLCELATPYVMYRAKCTTLIN